MIKLQICLVWQTLKNGKYKYAHFDRSQERSTKENQQIWGKTIRLVIWISAVETIWWLWFKMITARIFSMNLEERAIEQDSRLLVLQNWPLSLVVEREIHCWRGNPSKEISLSLFCEDSLNLWSFLFLLYFSALLLVCL